MDPGAAAEVGGRSSQPWRGGDGHVFLLWPSCL